MSGNWGLGRGLEGGGGGLGNERWEGEHGLTFNGAYEAELQIGIFPFLLYVYIFWVCLSSSILHRAFILLSTPMIRSPVWIRSGDWKRVAA
jgi:hypothetical protein